MVICAKIMPTFKIFFSINLDKDDFPICVSMGKKMMERVEVSLKNMNIPIWRLFTTYTILKVKVVTIKAVDLSRAIVPYSIHTAPQKEKTNKLKRTTDLKIWCGSHSTSYTTFQK